MALDRRTTQRFMPSTLRTAVCHVEHIIQYLCNIMSYTKFVFKRIQTLRKYTYLHLNNSSSIIRQRMIVVELLDVKVDAGQISELRDLNAVERPRARIRSYRFALLQAASSCSADRRDQDETPR